MESDVLSQNSRFLHFLYYGTERKSIGVKQANLWSGSDESIAVDSCCR